METHRGVATASLSRRSVANRGRSLLHTLVNMSIQDQKKKVESVESAEKDVLNLNILQTESFPCIQTNVLVFSRAAVVLGYLWDYICLCFFKIQAGTPGEQ